MAKKRRKKLKLTVKEIGEMWGLTADEVEAAKACGMTAKEYAEYKSPQPGARASAYQHLVSRGSKA
jgi:hypothetical protein